MRKTAASISPEFFRAQCREHGLRITPQRVEIYEELCRSGKHPTAEQLHAKVKLRFPNISLDTVNRTLLTLATIGLIEIVESYGGPRRYDPDLRAHHHVHCINCGAILDFDHPEFDNLKIPARIRRKYKIISQKVVLSGFCDKCGRKTSSKSKK